MPQNRFDFILSRRLESSSEESSRESAGPVVGWGELRFAIIKPRVKAVKSGARKVYGFGRAVKSGGRLADGFGKAVQSGTRWAGGIRNL